MIEVTQIRKSYGKKKVLSDITFQVKPGECVAIAGKNGCGKSTFLRCLNLLETPTEGEVWVEGNNITAPKTDIDKVRQKMGMVFQHTAGHAGVFQQLQPDPSAQKRPLQFSPPGQAPQPVICRQQCTGTENGQNHLSAAGRPGRGSRRSYPARHPPHGSAGKRCPYCGCRQ